MDDPIKRPRGQPKKRGIGKLLTVRFASEEMYQSVLEFLTVEERGTILAHAVGQKLLKEAAFSAASAKQS